MTRLVLGLVFLAMLATVAPASAGCLRVGTQLECGTGAGPLVLGSQATPGAAPRGDRPVQSLLGGPTGLDAERDSGRGMRFELQHFDPNAMQCRTFGNERYCY